MACWAAWRCGGVAFSVWTMVVWPSAAPCPFTLRSSLSMSSLPRTYEEWLALTDDERDHIKFNEWNTYARDGVAFAFMAAARLAIQSPYDVLGIQVGNYHCGEYLLHLTVSHDDFQKCPPMLEQRFEGFRVVWFPQRTYVIDPVMGANIEGRWVPEESSDDYEFEFRLTAEGVDVSGFCRATNQRLLISYASVNREYVLFEACHPALEKHTRHSFRLVTADRCEDSATKSEYYLRSGCEVRPQADATVGR